MFDELLATLYNTQQSHNYLVDNDGTVKDCTLETIDSPTTYRLYRFLTDLEDLLNSTANPEKILLTLIPKVRQLLTDSYWLQTDYSEPSRNLGWSVKILYQEPDYPITIQNVAWLPHQTSPIHNHGTWGIVAIISGSEKNKLWRRTSRKSDRLELVGEQILLPGDIIAFNPEAIHSVEPVGDEPTITFNLYGVTNFAARYEFDAVTHKAKNF
ncbi:hypothetical protein [Gloeocapsa sp. PCC 73106]|uniref:cysteine dioxygenase family protein n=1 Tax=Gloeocapsa sp. PCC 73106 TaxID=102232 RepID=UPI0002AD0BFE|nr:hypothetical protein [Gloeocapsa sp. PCC 73106]ELR97691.1 putative metal-dependent enzyme of the double-stranded beta helix superfamily [Gloeocapsa sp. PCC 73106]